MLVCTCAVAICASLLGVVLAAKSGVFADGQRGGALGCAITFLVFFLSFGHARTVLERPLPHEDDSNSPDQAWQTDPKIQHQRIVRLEASAAAGLDAASIEKLWLGAASFLSSIAWGFGDWFAEWLRYLLC